MATFSEYSASARCRQSWTSLTLTSTRIPSSSSMHSPSASGQRYSKDARTGSFAVVVDEPARIDAMLRPWRIPSRMARRLLVQLRARKP
jgi:hypothetical protein